MTSKSQTASGRASPTGRLHSRATLEVAVDSRKGYEATLRRIETQQAQLHEELRALTAAVREHSAATKALLRSRSVLPAGEERARVPQASQESPPSEPGVKDYDAAVRRGEERRAAWTRDGTLVSGTELATRWARSRQALDQACARHELFNLKVGNRLWYPAVFLRHNADEVRAVCRALGEGDAASMLVFWMRTHGGLGGRTVSEAIEAQQLDRVVELARAWAEEHGWAHAQAA